MMRIFVFSLLIMILPSALLAQPYVEVTAPANRQLKLAVEIPRTKDAAQSGETAQEMAEVTAFDMNMAGVVQAEIRESLPVSGGLLFGMEDFTPWQTGGFDLLVRGEYSISGDNLTVEFRLFDVVNRKTMTAKRFLGKKKDLRRFTHSFSDEILQQITGEKGCFTTRIAFVSRQSRNKEIFVMDWDGHNLVPLTRNGSINLNPDFSPDGREIIYTSYKKGNPDLYKRALSSIVEIPVSSRKGLNITGAWSPDGTKIALALSKDGNSEIYTIGKDGSQPMRLTVNPAIEVSPTWSPDGTRIAFVSDRLGKPQIFTMGVSGGSVQRLTTAGSYNVNPRWSPKGDKIAYARMQGGGFQIFTINSDGSGDTQLTTSGSNENPVWSADNRFIAFSSKRGGSEGIYVMRADGSGQTKVTPSKTNGTQPAWSRR